MTITCADCGEMQVIPPLSPGAMAACRRCDRLLDRRTRTGMDLALGSAAAVLILLPPGAFMPLMDRTIRNLIFGESRLVSSVQVIYSQVWFPLAYGFFFLAFLFPWLRALLQVLVLGSRRMGWKLWQHGRLFRWSEELRLWSMTDVVLVAGVASYVRTSIEADVTVRVGAWCYVLAAAFVIVADRSLDRRGVWNAIMPDLATFPDRRVASCDVCEMAVENRRAGDPCPRCGSRLDRNMAPRFAPALAAVGAAIPLAIPAYSAAIMINDQLTGVLESTVLGTVQMLADRGYPQVGVLILISGIVIPLVVVAGLIWLLARVWFPHSEGLVVRTRVYRVLHRLVRWAMAIPFSVALLAPIVKFRGIDDIVAGPGATPLFAVIALLVLAVRLFEPRLMWVVAGEAA